MWMENVPHGPCVRTRGPQLLGKVAEGELLWRKWVTEGRASGIPGLAPLLVCFLLPQDGFKVTRQLLLLPPCTRDGLNIHSNFKPK